MIRNEDQLKSLYDRVMNRTSEDDWAQAIEEAQKERRREELRETDDRIEHIFGMR